ncbi:hypothetical protein NEDG_02125 [Nematocida displodere]|uniref:PPPDE domain-containing protein n=1 Tax=Nematocida displodere TaxID=1805483 RepID=A0A177EK55_9MICR|nr:hypothetical protein NEDG_01435 [Nematocida displodere]OAG32258.1 hypothetical protein NEDG_02125 [Nematocida displodere]
MGAVEVWVYDITNGMAVSMLKEMVGADIKGIWHTSVVVFGKEYYFQGGIQRNSPGTTAFGRPVERLPFGETSLTEKDFEGFLQEVGYNFSNKTYDIFENNCNHFSNAAALHLVGKEVPSYIMDLPNLIKNSPAGELIKSFFQITASSPTQNTTSSPTHSTEDA